MQSASLLEQLESIPLRNSPTRCTWQMIVDHSRVMQNEYFAIAVVTGMEGALGALFNWRNVPDDLTQAYAAAYPGLSAQVDLQELYQTVLESGPDSLSGFVSGLKGKLAELRLTDQLEQEFPGYDFSLAADPTQPVWDLSGVGPEGTEEILVQVKVGTAAYAGEVIERMEADPGVLFAVSSELRERILELHPEFADQLTEATLSNFALGEAVEADLSLLAQNLGIDVPDSIGEILPYVGEILLGIRLILDIVRVERDFTTVRVDDRRRIQGMQAIVLCSRFGISTVLTTVGGAIGTAAFPGIGSILGAIAGASTAGVLNAGLKPHMLELAMGLMNIGPDDLFYFRNKPRIDDLGASLARTAGTCLVPPLPRVGGKLTDAL